jgi:hypothetical protein
MTTTFLVQFDESMYSSTTCTHGHGPELHGGDCRSEWEAIARTVGLQPKQIHRRRRGPWLRCGRHIVAGGGPTTWGGQGLQQVGVVVGTSSSRSWSGQGCAERHCPRTAASLRSCGRAVEGSSYICKTHTNRWGSELRSCNDARARHDCCGKYLRFTHNFVVGYVRPINTTLPRCLRFMKHHWELHTIVPWFITLITVIIIGTYQLHGLYDVPSNCVQQNQSWGMKSVRCLYNCSHGNWCLTAVYTFPDAKSWSVISPTTQFALGHK